LTYEVQFGFDVARMQRSSFMCAVAIMDPAGSEPYFAYADIKSGDLIPERAIVKFISERLERFRAVHGRAPRSILFQRKGRLPDSEARAIQKAIDQYAARHRYDSHPDWAIVTIEKTMSAPVRLFADDGDGQVSMFTVYCQWSVHDNLPPPGRQHWSVLRWMHCQVVVAGGNSFRA
jgi:hypothetical protein